MSVWNHDNLSRCPRSVAANMPFLVKLVIVVKILNRDVAVPSEAQTCAHWKGKNMLAEVIGKAQGFERCANIVRMKLILAGISYGLDPSQLDNLVYKT